MPSGRFRFGLFEFDPDTLELRREGAIIHLQAQPGQVLASLVKHADRIVSREELRKAVWGDQTFVDFERGLNFCVSQIRAALGDDAARPIYVRTVARQGYQFIAPVEWIVSSKGPTTRVNIARPLSQRVLLTAAVVFGLTAIGLAYMFHLRHAPKKLPIVAVVRFDNETADPALTRLADDLTDNVVERLTALSSEHYAVIGNARILRGPRNERDLNAISTTLRADFVVLGQIQAYQGQTRILAHLIHMPEQTHLSVARMDRPLTNPLELEAEAAQKIAANFSQRLAAVHPAALSSATSY